MIRIRKADVAPAVLTTKGTTACTVLCAEYDRGERVFTFHSAIYAHGDVRDALRNAQHDKCAFCESKFAHIAYGDVEHFRPKGAVRQSETAELQSPGYYWLAYKWDNLFLSCQLCNQKFKRECFPLRVQKHRARSHSDDLAREEPLLLNPPASPEKHVSFNGEMAVPVRKSLKGKITIQVLKLNRPELLELRLERRRMLLTTQNARDELLRLAPNPMNARTQRILRELEEILKNAITDDAEYSAMARAMLA